jgi:hypothetical protein
LGDFTSSPVQDPGEEGQERNLRSKTTVALSLSGGGNNNTFPVTAKIVSTQTFGFYVTVPQRLLFLSTRRRPLGQHSTLLRVRLTVLSPSTCLVHSMEW